MWSAGFAVVYPYVIGLKPNLKFVTFYDAKSLLYGVNGFAYTVCPGATYHAPEDDYSSIIE